MFQMKEQEKLSEKELNETEISNLPDKEFKVMIIKMLTELWRRVDEHSENFNKELENRKKNPSELRNTITEVKNTLEGINSRLDDTEGQISDLEYRVLEITQTEQKKRKKEFLK